MPNLLYPDGGWQSMIFSSDHGSQRQHAYRLLLFLTPVSVARRNRAYQQSR